MKNFRFFAACTVMTLVMGSTAWAVTPKAQYATDSKKALELYQQDKQLCNGEATPEARMQCKRDAKAGYDKAIATAKAELSAATKGVTKPACVDCGKVVAVNMAEKEGEGTALGVLAGGAAGALLGNQVGSGTGKDLATIAGAVGGAYAGKKIEEKMKTVKVWTVSVQYNDGGKGDFEFQQDPGLKAGDLIKKSGNTIVRQ